MSMLRRPKEPESDRHAIARANLRKFREAMGWSHDKVATLLGNAISASTIAKIELGGEKGRSLPDVVLLNQLLKLYGHTVEELFEATPPPSNSDLQPVFAPLMVVLKKEDAALIGDEIAAVQQYLEKADADLRAKLKQRKQRQRK